MAFFQAARRALNLAQNSPALSRSTTLLSECGRRFFSAQIPVEYRRLEGKVAIITGAASGIGEATAKRFVAHGAKVLIGDIHDELGPRLAESLHPHAKFFHCDVSRDEDVSAIVDLALSEHGHLDVMFNNAGVPGGGFRTPAEMSMEDFHRVMDINVCGVMSGVKHAARAMLEHNTRGSILCTASGASILAGRYAPAYTASKHAVVGIVKSAASDLAPFGIRVNCVSPFAVLTPLLVKLFAEGMPNVAPTRESVSEYVERCSEFRGAMLDADDVAKAALFLSCDDARYISGHNLVIDGAFGSSKQLLMSPADR